MANLLSVLALIVGIPTYGSSQEVGSYVEWLLRSLDVLGLEAEAYEAGGELLEAGDGGEELEEEWGFDGAGVVEDSVEDAVGEDLDALGVVDGALAVVLDAGEVVGGGGVGEEGFGEDVGGGDGVL